MEGANEHGGEAPLLEQCISPAEILQRLNELTKPYAQDIAGISLYCNKDTADRIFCGINVNANAQAIASAIGGEANGEFLVSREIHPIWSDFRCVIRESGTLLMAACSRCSTNQAKS